MPAMPGCRLFALSCLLVLSSCCAHDKPPPPAAAVAPAAQIAPVALAGGAGEPTTAEGCRACSGEWAAHGINPQPSCLCPTIDAGKRCRDGGECQGQCLADDGEHEITAAGPPARGYFVGRCSRTRTSFGCHRPISTGALKAGPIALDEPPAQLCAD
jgi:hypothetical protein